MPDSRFTMADQIPNSARLTDHAIAPRVKHYGLLAAQLAGDRSCSVRDVLLLALFCLAAAHLSVKALFSSPVLWLVGAAAITLAGVWWSVKRKDEFGLCLAMFACAHFAFADNQGGLWSYVLCAVFIGAGTWRPLRKGRVGRPRWRHRSTRIVGKGGWRSNRSV